VPGKGNRQKMRGGAAARWSRLDWAGLGMPIPAVYIPQRSLPPDTRSMWGFEPISIRPANRDIPFAWRGGLTLAADINSTDGMDLLSVPAAMFTGTGEPVAVAEPQLLARGHFTDAHPPEWKDAAWAAQALLVVIGPDDFPGLDLSLVEGSDREDPAEVREGTRRLVSELWVFKAAVACVHLVMAA
jgi:hypothetical protein